MRRSRLPLTALIGAPLAVLSIGGGIGWFTRGTTESGAATVPTVVGATVPADLDQFAPPRRIAQPPNPAVIDPASIIGLQPAGALYVAPNAAVELPLTAGGTATAVDAITHRPGPLQSPAGFVGAATQLTALAPLAMPESTLPLPADPTLGDTTTTLHEPTFTDPCLTATTTTPCAGLPAVVTDEPSADTALDPLQISFPVSGAEGYAAQCDEIQQGNVPDTALSPATRPTVVVIVNQPSTLALTGTWADGATLDKTTLVTSPADDAVWQRSWDQDRVQRNIVACVTLPLDDVRAHATDGIGALHADILAISATGKADISGQVTLNIPTDDDNSFFAERLAIADRGEQRRADGVLYPTVHVHYAFVTDAVTADNPRLDPTSTHVYAQHVFIEGADCNGWTNNQQGRDRTSSSLLSVTSEERTVAGRTRNVTVVDGDVYLDPMMPSGWKGQFCVRLVATDQPPGASGAASRDAVTLALQGAALRAPRTASYALSVQVSDGADGLDVAWTTPAGVPMCTSASLTAQDPGASCAVNSRLADDGVWVVLNRDGQQLFAALVPINSSYCNPDDPYGALADGCSRGYTQPLQPADSDGTTISVVLQVDRTADAGTLLQDPSQAWQVEPVTSFTT